MYDKIVWKEREKEEKEGERASERYTIAVSDAHHTAETNLTDMYSMWQFSYNNTNK